MSSIFIEGHAIVSSDGMIAAGDGSMPERLRNDADWRLFQAALDRAALVVLGRDGHERHPNPGRRRLVATSRVTGLERDPADPLATFWNPQITPFADVPPALGIKQGIIAVTGGTQVFDLFLTQGYHAFALAIVEGWTLPGGRPAFSAGTPQAMLEAHGLVATGTGLIDENAGVTLTQWTKHTKSSFPNSL